MYELYYDGNIYLIETLWDKFKQAFDPLHHGNQPAYVHKLSVNPVEGEATGCLDGYVFSGPDDVKYIVENGKWELL